MVFQSYALYPHYNVYDNLAFGLRAKSSKGINLILQIIILLLYGIFIGALYGLSYLLNFILSGLGSIIFVGGLVSFLATVLLFSEIRNSIRDGIINTIAKFSGPVRRYVESEQNIQEKVVETATLLEIKEQLYKKQRQLSGGQRSLVPMVSRTIVQQGTSVVLTSGFGMRPGDPHHYDRPTT